MSEHEHGCGVKVPGGIEAANGQGGPDSRPLAIRSDSQRGEGGVEVMAVRPETAEHDAAHQLPVLKGDQFEHRFGVGAQAFDDATLGGPPECGVEDVSDPRMVPGAGVADLEVHGGTPSQSPATHSTSAPSALRFSTKRGWARWIGAALRMVERPSMLAASMKRAMATRMM